ncbi:MAG: N-acetyl sugar amidotransferase, partial [Candidatus Omnitrophota bacterium]|nr:N-acetyl sugar amidotransferase [Candidatus Omnitrophota bacterium]
LDERYPLNEKGQRKFKKLIDTVKARGRKNNYDCIVGISGGRDSTYSLYLTKQLGLKPLAVHFNDGFGNPVAGENIKKATQKLNVGLRTITSDWRESKDLKIAFLKASTPDLEEGTDLGIATALYGTAVRENVKYIIIGQSFRTEGVSPLEWNYLDGKYLQSVHKRFGTVKLKRWKPADPGFNLNIYHIFYYTVLKQIKTIPLFYHINYVRRDVDEILRKELDWVYPGAHFFDDLYQSLMTYIYRIKFKSDRRKAHYSALIRSGQMSREEALERIKEIYVIEDPKVIDLCIKRLGITRQEFDGYLRGPPKTFRDYPTDYAYIRSMRFIIKILSMLDILPYVTYAKYFECI